MAILQRGFSPLGNRSFFAVLLSRIFGKTLLASQDVLEIAILQGTGLPTRTKRSWSVKSRTRGGCRSTTVDDGFGKKKGGLSLQLFPSPATLGKPIDLLYLRSGLFLLLRLTLRWSSTRKISPPQRSYNDPTPAIMLVSICAPPQQHKGEDPTGRGFLPGLGRGPSC